ncbi:MAG: dipeptide epimerase [Gammaproteobacteria bacterium]|nr:dipeptide epimerase [Gammaproteobacteria bacterium]
MSQVVAATAERWPIAGEFTISRGSKSAADVVVVSVEDRGLTGAGECLPYARYGESTAATIEQIEALALPITRDSLQALLPAGSARNAVDCALWDVEAKREGRPVWQLAGLCEPRGVTTAFTLGIDTVDATRAKAEEHCQRRLLKVKLGGADAVNDVARLRAVRAGAPDSELIVDANEGWTFEFLTEIATAAADIGVALLEQPLPAGADDALRHFHSPVPIGADESLHAESDLEALVLKYQVVNIKLDKTGGLTHAIEVRRRALDLGFEIMIGCMVATSLSMAPALLLAPGARFVDLDGPLLLAQDRQPGLVYDGSMVSFGESVFWGDA